MEMITSRKTKAKSTVRPWAFSERKESCDGGLNLWQTGSEQW
jgi:hypothetical protein